jgi:Flp pilus assembly protein TadD
MSFNPKCTPKTIIAALVIPLCAAAGCGTDDDTFVKKAPKSNLTETATAPQPAAATAPAVEPVQDVTYESAEQTFLSGRYAEAVDQFSRYTERESSNPWGHYMLGLAAWKDGRLDVAEAAFQQSLTLDPDHLKSCVNLARVLMDNHRASEALTVLDRALAIDSTSSTAHRLKGNAYAGLGRADDAVASYRRAIALDPTDAWSMNNLAYLWIQQGRYEEALPALARATELRTDVAVFYNNLGMALEHTGQFIDAAGAYEFAVSLDGSNARAALNRDRVSGVREDPSLPAVNLAALALTFQTTIEGWKLAGTTAAPADSVVSVQPQ